MRMRLPDDDEIDTAIMWLQSNDGGAGESERCKVVADYLDHLKNEAYLRREARSVGIPVARLRRRLAETAAKDAP